MPTINDTDIEGVLTFEMGQIICDI